MRRMNGLDRMFLFVESERLPMDLIGIFILDPSTAPDLAHDFQRVRAELAARITRVPLFTSRPIYAPFAAGHERWLTVDEFDIDHHLKHVGVPAPRDFGALCELVSTLVNKPLDRDRPLWHAYYVDGFADGSAALLLRLHHASVDGVGGMQLMAELFDTEPLPASAIPAATSVHGERVPLPAELLVRSVPDQVMNGIRFLEHAIPLADPVIRGLMSRLLPGKAAQQQPPSSDKPEDGVTPRSLFNRPTETGKRAVSGTSVSMADVRTITDRFGVTVNDVVLSVTNAAVVDYLRGRGELPDEPLRVTGPVNIREESATAADGNHFTFMLTAIPDITDPVERLKTVAARTAKARPERTARAGDPTVRKPTGAVLENVMGLVDSLPGATWFAVRDLVTSRLFNAVPPVVNYIVSNIPGPKGKLYLAGAEITHIHGRTMVGGGVGLFVFCVSHADTLDFGITTLAELVPDPAKIADGISHHFAILLAG
jgi:diacylglycerol O-acyltransferase / wax synthase